VAAAPRFRFGICGLGFAGAVLMAPAMKSHPHARIAAACEPNEGVRTAFGAEHDVPTYATLAEMIDAGGLDAVYVASPHQFHAEQVIQAATRGLHVIVEKPLTLSVDEGRQMADAVRRAGVKLVVGTSRSHDPVVGTMRDLVRGGTVGRVGMISCINYTDFLYRPRRPEELDTARGGGIVFNQLPHQVDCVKAISDKRVIAVRAMTGRLAEGRPTEGHCAALLTLEDGVSASLVYSGYDHFDSDELQFWIAEGGRAKKPGHGNARRVLKELQGPEAELRRTRYGFGGPVAKAMAAGDTGRMQPHFGMMVVTCERADLRASPDGVLVYGDDGITQVAARVGAGSYGQGDTIDELVAAVRDGTPVLRDADWGVDTVRVCRAILESSASGAQVQLPPLT
jgi:phthalate 4,5-cis-dihydrodiol dehydrogenase